MGVHHACGRRGGWAGTGRFPASVSRTRLHAFACNAICSFWTFIGVDRFPNLQVLHHVLRRSSLTDGPASAVGSESGEDRAGAPLLQQCSIPHRYYTGFQYCSLPGAQIVCRQPAANARRIPRLSGSRGAQHKERTVDSWRYSSAAATLIQG